MKPSFGDNARIDLDRLIETRLLVQANSGGGKSWAVRRLLEQTHSKVQQIVIDVEDEFHTLREKFDYVLAGKNGDCPADVRCAAQLARKLLELNASCIVNIYELKHRERIQFVKLFLDSMISTPRELWHPVLVVIDEAHIFAPQVGEAESGSAVIDLMTRGRKRGMCGVLCTQRISKLHKDAAAEANNKLIGRSALDVDMKRASDEIGFTSRDQQNTLRTLSPGEFYSFGPALSPTVEKIRVGTVQTTHPKIGQRHVLVSPPREKVRKVLEKLADLPQQVEQEKQTVATLQARVRELEAQLKKAPQVDPLTIKQAVERGQVETATELSRRVFQAVKNMDDWKATLGTKLLEIFHKPKAPFIAPKNIPPMRSVKTTTTKAPDADKSLGKCERAILTALAQCGKCSKSRAAIVSGYSVTSGSFNNSLSKLRTAGYLDGPGECMEITSTGMDALGDYDRLPSDPAELVAYWIRELSKCEGEILRVVTGAYPQELTKEDIAQQTSYSVTSGSFNNSLSKLRTLELIEGYGAIKAARELMG